MKHGNPFRAGVCGLVLVAVSGAGLGADAPPPAVPGTPTGGDGPEAAFLRLQESIAGIVSEIEEKILDGTGVPSRDARLEAMLKESSRRLKNDPALARRLREQGMLFDGFRWFPPVEKEAVCERIERFGMAGTALREGIRTLDKRIRAIEARKNAARDQAQMSSVGVPAGSSPAIQAQSAPRGVHTRSGALPVTHKKRNEPSVVEKAVASASVASDDLKKLKASRNDLADIKEAADRQLKILLSIPDVEKWLRAEGYIKVEGGAWIKV